MGYDMTIVESTKDQDAYERASKRFSVACERRNAIPRESPEYTAAQTEVEAAYDEMLNHDTDYFRLNIWGMGKMRNAMQKLGMLSFDYEERAWPEDGDAEVQEAYLSWSPEGAPGIPEHKLCSNDGWTVTPEDIAGALSMLSTSDPADVERVTAELGDTFTRWVEYLKRAADHGGFKVY